MESRPLCGAQRREDRLLDAVHGLFETLDQFGARWSDMHPAASRVTLLRLALHESAPLESGQEP